MASIGMSCVMCYDSSMSNDRHVEPFFLFFYQRQVEHIEKVNGHVNLKFLLSVLEIIGFGQRLI